MKPVFSRPALLLIGLALLLVSSCKKDPYELGIDLLPGSDTLNVKTIDTSTIIAYSVLHDSIRTDKKTLNLLGSMMDPVFGITTSDLYSQFILTTESPDFDPGAVLDSVVLQLGYAGIYGDTNSAQTLKVYEISEDIDYDSSYYSNDQIQTYTNLLATHTFVPKPNDSVLVGTKKVTPHIRINLSNLTHYFGNKLLSAPADVLSSNTAFVKFMKGLAVKSEPVASGGVQISVNYKAPITRMVLYYNYTDSIVHHVAYEFSISEGCARTNLFNHNGYLNASPELQSQILNHDTADGREKLFVQGLGGVQIKLRLPYITELNNLGKIAINNATLVLTNFETDTTYAPVPVLYLLKKDSAGRIAFPVDYAEGTAYFGGEYNKDKKTYTFRITRHIEQIIQGRTKNYDLYIMAASPIGSTLVPNRVIVNGTNPTGANSGSRLKLEVVYTKLY